MLLRTICADPERRLSELPFLTDDERRVILHEWRGPRESRVSDGVLSLAFEEQAARTPDAIAIAFEWRHLTYKALNRYTNRIAHRLRSYGVGPEKRVAVLLERSLEAVAATLGILKSGGVCVPIDTAYPLERVERLLADSGAVAVVTKRGICPAPIAGQHTILWLDEDTLHREPMDNPPCDVHPANLAYLMYTSGSSGAPKGVGVTHGSISRFATVMAAELDMRPSDRILQFASMSFDVVLEELWPAWIRGAAVVMRPDLLPAPAELNECMHREQITVVELPTAWWQQWVSELATFTLTRPPGLRLVLMGGETCSMEHVASWQALQVPLVHVYGLTETTVTSTTFLVSPVTTLGRSLPIGRPTGMAEMFVLDVYGDPVPSGVVGEIYIGGPGVARGYLGHPALTAQKFIPSPFGGFGKRLYSTGDRGRWLPAGDIEFLGRGDQQVKIRGYRIEIAEIEAALNSYPGVTQSAIVVDQDSAGKRLVAYVVSGAFPIHATELRRWLQARLPEYMIPQAFVTIDQLPLTPNGKLDRARLPLPEPADGTLHVAGRNAVEEALVAIWQDVLRTDRIAIDDHFFALGGHSLLATQVVSRIGKHFQIDFPLRHMFDAPTIRELAALVTEHQTAAILEAGNPLELLEEIERLSDEEVRVLSA